MTRRCLRLLAPLTVVATLCLCAAPPPAAQAFDPSKPICTLAGLVSGIAGKVCSAARHAGSVLKAGQKLLGGHVGGAAETLVGGGTATRAITATAAIAATAAWVMGGARLMMRETGAVISSTTRPQLQSTWFSSSYWRMAAISALLTLPFLFAAAVQALLRSDLSLLARSALGYLPLGLLAVSIAAPLTQLLLAASDEMSALVSSASSFSGAGVVKIGTLGLLSGSVSSFPLFFVGLLSVAATMALWIELLIRSAAVYVIVLMLPLFFAALVWPARRVWAARAIELLVALILSKFAIVAVLALGSAAIGHTAGPSIAQMLAGTTLIMLAAFTPWALLRLLPLHELAAGVDGLHQGGSRGLGHADAGTAAAQDRMDAFAAELSEARAERRRGEAVQESPARSVLAGLGGEPAGGPAGGSNGPAGGGSGPAGGGNGPAGGSAGPPAGGSTGPPAGGSTGPPARGSSGPEPTVEDPLAGLIDEHSAWRGHSERLPEMDAHWQRPNFSWSPLQLGPDTLPEGPLGPGASVHPPEVPDPPPPPAPLATGESRETGLDPWSGAEEPGER